jgi:uncharacterized protein YbjT (DUF2867 family)
MTVLVIGAHGAVGRKLLPVLRDAGHEVRGMIRDGDQAPTIRSLGAEPVVGDLEGDFAHHLEGCDAVVFTAGSGGGSGADKTVAVDGLGAIRAVDAASEHGLRRFVMVSALGAGDPDRSEAIRHYLVAKGIADGYLERSGLDHTILRPGRLTDEEPTGRIHLDDDGGGGSVTRADVAHVAALCLAHRNTVGRILPLLNGETPVETALREV